MQRHAPLVSIMLLCLCAAAVSAAPAKPKPKPVTTPPASAPAEKPAERSAPAEVSGPPLERARELYGDAKFDEAVTLLTAALRDGRVTGDEVSRARELRARCLVKLGRRVEAKEAFKANLRTDESYRPDANNVPPDEMDVFRTAFKEYQAEQVEAGTRYPASIGVLYGAGQAVNQDLVDLASSAGVGAADDFKASQEFGYSVRLPIKPRWSVEFEISRFRATTEDQLPAARNAHQKYTAYALPLVVSIMHHHSTNPIWHLTSFAGLGLMPSEADLQADNTLVSGRVIPAQIVGRGTGLYAHIGAEVEYHLQPRLALSGRVLARYANSGNLKWPRNDFEVYESYPVSRLGDRAIDFSGIAAHVGLRAYIGY